MRIGLIFSVVAVMLSFAFMPEIPTALNNECPCDDLGVNGAFEHWGYETTFVGYDSQGRQVFVRMCVSGAYGGCGEND